MKNSYFNTLFTCAKNVETKAKAVRDTWSKRCDKTLFVSDQMHPSFPTVVPRGFVRGYNYLWSKTRAAFQYTHDHLLNDFEWFLKADDDTYVIVENLKHYLSAFSTHEGGSETTYI